MKLTIIGCGLIGGSLALALKRRRPAWPVACLDLAQRIPAIREAEVCPVVAPMEDAAKFIPDSDVVLLAVPVEATVRTLSQIGPHLKSGAIVTDVGSTKGEIMAQAPSHLPPGAVFIGGHPMAGSERSGVEAADALLFVERTWVLCPYPDTPPEALTGLMDLAESVLARPLTMDAQEHDAMVAMISHLPQLLSTTLMLAAEEEDATHTMLQTLAGRGFLDMTRIAASEYSVWSGILQTNREAIIRAVDRFIEKLSQLRNAVAKGDASAPWGALGKAEEEAGAGEPPAAPQGGPARHDRRVRPADRFGAGAADAVGAEDRADQEAPGHGGPRHGPRKEHAPRAPGMGQIARRAAGAYRGASR